MDVAGNARARLGTNERIDRESNDDAKRRYAESVRDDRRERGNGFVCAREGTRARRRRRDETREEGSR